MRKHFREVRSCPGGAEVVLPRPVMYRQATRLPVRFKLDSKFAYTFVNNCVRGFVGRPPESMLVHLQRVLTCICGGRIYAFSWMTPHEAGITLGWLLRVGPQNFLMDTTSHPRSIARASSPEFILDYWYDHGETPEIRGIKERDQAKALIANRSDGGPAGGLKLFTGLELLEVLRRPAGFFNKKPAAKQKAVRPLVAVPRRLVKSQRAQQRRTKGEVEYDDTYDEYF